MPADTLRAAGVSVGARLCLALSGGLDSRVLLHQLLALRGEFSFVLSALHVHHGLNPQADQWAAFCAKLCREAGVPFRCVSVEVPRDDPAGLEAAARRLRHAALNAEPADWRVFAHHQDDQAETLLFRLARGTGVRGAAVMTAIEHAATPGASGVLRPLLSWRRARLHDYARAHDLRWVEDGSNADPRFTRNALRHQVLPALEGIFPAVVPTLARAAQNFAEAACLLDALAELDWRRCGQTDERGGVALAELLALDDARVVNALRGVLQRAGAQAPARAQIRECVRQLRSSAAALHFPFDGVALGSYRGRLWQVAATPALPPRVWQGEAALPWPGGEIAFVPTLGQGLSSAALGGLPLELGARQAGISLRLAIGRPRRSFKNLVQEAGLPPWLRECLPVLHAGGEAVWIGGIGMAAEWRCRSGAEGVLPVWRAAGALEEDGQCSPYGLLLK